MLKLRKTPEELKEPGSSPAPEEKKHARASKNGDAAAYARHKEDMRQRMAAKAAAANELGPLPEVVNPERREACRLNLQLFAETYVRGLFKGLTKRWAPFHIEMFRTFQDAILNGGNSAVAVPRGSGKSAITKAAIIWAGNYGHCRFAVVVCASNVLSKVFLRSVKKQLNGSRKMLEDFPEVCVPIRALKNKASKCNGQTLNGVRTASEWKTDYIVYPSVPGAASSGYRCATTGITGSGLRGLIDAKEDAEESGEVMEERVDLVLVDDWQTRGSARSVNQTATRLEIMRGDILGMAGPGEKFACLASMTVIQPHDGADQLLEDPDWQGIRYGILTKLPDNMELWKKYQDIRRESKQRKLGVGPQNDFYRANRDEMDRGTEATWPDRFNPKTELSGIQGAMNLLFEVKPPAWWAEYMNRPERGKENKIPMLKAENLRERLNRVDRYEVPLGFDTITVGADVQGTILFYWVAAYKSDFTGSVIDVGTVPDQGGRPIAHLDDLAKTLQSESGASDADLHAAIMWGLNELGKNVLDRQYIREDGQPLRVKRTHIDINWEPSESAVGEFCRLSKWAGTAFPARGRAITNLSRRISDWKDKPGEKHPPKAIRRDCEWMMTAPTRQLISECRHLKSFWHGRLIKAFSKTMGASGAMSFFGVNSDAIEAVIEHLIVHDPLEKKIGEDEFVQYIHKVGATRWDWLDCGIGSMVAASIEGIHLANEHEMIQHTKPKKRPIGPVEADY